jgi:ornithine cyclodeaminase
MTAASRRGDRVQLTLLTAEDIRAALPMADAVQAMKDAFAAFSSGRAVVPLRPVIPVPPADGMMLVKPAYVPGGGLGAKLVGVFPRNARVGKPTINGLVILLDPQTGEPTALCDGGFVTSWRTGAASGAATDVLARSDARVGAVLGCGAQGPTQALGIATVRSLQEIRVYDRSPDKAARLTEKMQPELEARLVPVPSARAAVEGADVICAATTSATPVVEGRLLRAGAHVNGIGSFTAEMQEIDTAAVARSRVFVDSLESARVEAGDLVIASERGETRPEDWTEIGRVFEGAAPGRGSPEEITLFKSVGVAVQDVAAVSLALERARARGLGSTVTL